MCRKSWGSHLEPDFSGSFVYSQAATPGPIRPHPDEFGANSGANLFHRRLLINRTQALITTPLGLESRNYTTGKRPRSPQHIPRRQAPAAQAAGWPPGSIFFILRGQTNY